MHRHHGPSLVNRLRTLGEAEFGYPLEPFLQGHSRFEPGQMEPGAAMWPCGEGGARDVLALPVELPGIIISSSSSPPSAVGNRTMSPALSVMPR